MSNKINPSAPSRRTRKRYTKQFKQDAVDMVVRSGRPAAQVARELGVNENLMAKWVRIHLEEMDRTAEAVDGMSPSEMASEIRRLQGELDHVSEQRDILKKALNIVGSEKTGGRRS